MKSSRFFRCFWLAPLFAAAYLPAQPDNGKHEIRNIIMMVPDGMGLADVTATRLRLNGPDGPPLNLETLEHVGYQRTYSKTNTITDSSAAASAFACGEKYVNNEVCLHADGAPHNPSVLELAKSQGMATGLVATQTITHATPAAFAAHHKNRNCETEIARQYVTETQPDVLLGGGQATFRPSSPDACNVTGDYITMAKAAGYTYVETRDALLAALDKSPKRLLGLFAPKSLSPDYRRAAGTTEPRLPEMTSAALSILSRSRSGFFLMVEGSLIDSGNHEENLEYQTSEIKAFDEAVKFVLNWINASAERQQHTLLIILPDHETGGFVVKGMGPKGGELPNQGLGDFTPSWAFPLTPGSQYDFEAHHTGTDVVIWSQGPGSEALGRAIDNTDVYKVVKNALKL